MSLLYFPIIVSLFAIAFVWFLVMQIKKSPSISREPKIALVAGQDGLKYYKELFKQLKNVSYKTLILFCEIDPSQTKNINSLAKNNFPKAKLEIIKDLAGLDRFLKIAVL